ncbi:MAG: hypothetical protein RIT27_459 [Pseudomonadota bacterium]|jgi:chorismate mutase
MAEFSFKTLAEDLLTLEVNTIVKANMMAIKMPSNRREALLEIARDYHLALVELGCREPLVWTSGGIMAFFELRSRAIQGAKVISDLEHLMTKTEHQKYFEKKVILDRIQSQSEQLISLFVSLAKNVNASFDLQAYRHEMNTKANDLAKEKEKPLEELYKFCDLHDEENQVWNNDLPRSKMQDIEDLDLSAAQISLIRKVWEIGTEQVVLQTVIHADGDITTRISERLLENPNQILFQIHHESVQGAVGFWTNLVETIGKMAAHFFQTKILKK